MSKKYAAIYVIQLMMLLIILFSACTTIENDVNAAPSPTKTLAIEAVITEVVPELTTPSEASMVSTPEISSTKQTPLVLPTAIATSTATPNPTPTNVPASTASSVPQDPLPDVLLNIALSDNPLFSCIEPDQLGEIWLSQYPFDKAEQLLADDLTGYYEPVWSPDGERLAYIAVDTENVREETQSNGHWRQFESSLWVMDNDGANVREVSSKFTRSEFNSTENNSCSVTSGIVSIIGWSFDGTWLAFTVSPEELYNSDLSLYVTNIETGSTSLLLEKVGDAFWWPDKDTIVATTYEVPAAIEIIHMENPERTESTFVPPHFPAEYTLYQSQLSADMNSLFVIVTDESFYNAPASLWQVNIQTGEWAEITDLDLTGMHGMNFSIGEQNALLCARKDGQNVIEVLDWSTWDVLGSTEKVEGLTCDIARLSDQDENELVSFTSIIEKQVIWKSIITESKLMPEKVIDGRLLGFPEGVTIASYSWKPR